MILTKEHLMTETADHGWLYQRIVEDNPIAVLFADRDGKIRFWNSSAEAMFGYGAEEALGQSLDLIVPERQRARHWEGWASVMASGVTKYGRDALAVPAMRKDGSRISIEFNIILLRSPAGELLGAVAMIQDVTVRWQQQKEMRARLAALEAQAPRGGA
jgi:PAS domain S-box-containing protein